MYGISEVQNGTVTVLSKDSRCLVRVQPEDGRVEFLSFPNRSQAETAARLIRSRLGKPRPASDVTYDEFYELWRDKHLLPELTSRYFSQCDSTHRLRLSPRLGDLPLSEIDQERVEALRRALEKEMGPRQAYKQLDVLSAVLGKAVVWWYLEENPVQKIG